MGGTFSEIGSGETSARRQSGLSVGKDYITAQDRENRVAKYKTRGNEPGTDLHQYLRRICHLFVVCLSDTYVGRGRIKQV